MDTTYICPDGDTRTQKQLIVKLIVAHFTAVVAFCNLQLLRNERLDSIEPVLFILSPIIVVTQTSLGLIVIHVSLLLNVLQSPSSFSDHAATHARRLNTLFGKNARLGYSQVNISPTGSRINNKVGAVSRHRRTWLRYGGAIALATLFQSAATIFLYQRRKTLHGWDSLTIVDHRTFELAVGGATASAMSLTLLLKLPGFGQAPETEYVPDIDPDSIVIFCRGDSRRCPSWYQIIYFDDLGSTTSASTWFTCVASSTYKGRSLGLEFLQYAYVSIFEGASEILSLNMSLTTFYFLLGLFLASSIAISKYFPADRLPKSMWVMIPLCILGFLFFITVFYMGLLIVGPMILAWIPAMLSGPGCILTMKGYETRALFSQPPFGPLTNATDCLLLWKDPVAENMWSLV